MIIYDENLLVYANKDYSQELAKLDFVLLRVTGTELHKNQKGFLDRYNSTDFIDHDMVTKHTGRETKLDFFGNRIAPQIFGATLTPFWLQFGDAVRNRDFEVFYVVQIALVSIKKDKAEYYVGLSKSKESEKYDVTLPLLELANRFTLIS